MSFDLSAIKNVFVFGTGISAGRGIPLGNSLLADVFRIYNNPKRKTNDESPYYRSMYLKVINNLKKHYYFENDEKEEINIDKFKNILKNKEIDFEDYFSRDLLENEIELFSGKSNKITNSVEPNLMRLLYWYFWHHARNWQDLDEFPGEKDSEYIDILLSKLDSSSAIITTNYDLILEGLDNTKVEMPEKWKVSYKPEWIKNNDHVLYLKIHGSVNWVESQTLPDQIVIEENKNGKTYTKEVNDKNKYPDYISDSKGNTIKIFNGYFRDTYEDPTLKAVIFPPTYFKGLNTDDVQKMLLDHIWRNAIKCLKNARKIIFAGLSLRDSDLMLQLLLKQGIAENRNNPKIYLNYYRDHSVIGRYSKLFDIEKIYPKRFEKFVREDLEKILKN